MQMLNRGPEIASCVMMIMIILDDNYYIIRIIIIVMQMLNRGPEIASCVMTVIWRSFCRVLTLLLSPLSSTSTTS